MAIYKYTLFKYLKSVSTWIITGISIILILVIGGYLPWSFFQPDRGAAAINYAMTSIAVVAGITSFLALFTSVFTGFKAATMYKDEVEDGTFLVMLSKPITRSKIILFKWFALQTIIAIYTLIIAISFLVAIAIFDKGGHVVGLSKLGITTLRSNSLTISAALWGILFVVSLIFSSIALLISTKMSVGTTIGISGALGVIIPITSLIGTFTAKTEYFNANTSYAATVEVGAQQLEKSLADHLPIGVSAEDLAKFTQEMPVLTDVRNTLYDLGVETKEKDAFKVGRFFDLNYQIQSLSEFASDIAIPDSLKGSLKSAPSQMMLRLTRVKVSNDNTFTSDQLGQMSNFNKLVVNSWLKTEPYRQRLMQFLSLLVASNTTTLKDINISYGSYKVSLNKSNALKFFNILVPAPSLPQDFKFDFDNEIYRYAYMAYTEWQKLYASATTDANRDIVLKAYSRVTQFMSNLGWTFYQDGSLLGVDDPNLISEVENIGYYLSKANLPISFWVDTDVFQKLRSSNYRELTTSYSDAETKDLGLLKEAVFVMEETPYNEVASAVKNDYHIVKIENTSYVSKSVVLWIYLALAIALVPVAYFVVRKQDFR